MAPRRPRRQARRVRPVANAGRLRAAGECGLNSLRSSGDLAILQVDQACTIVWFNPAAQHILHLAAKDEGSSIRSGSARILGDSLGDDVAEVALFGKPRQRVVHGRGNGWYLYRAVPCRGTSGIADGVMVMVIEVTDARREQRKADQSASMATRRLEGLVAAGDERIERLSHELIRVEERERKALAEDLHDNLLQLLIAAQFKLNHVQENPDDASCRVAETLEILSQVTRQVRSLAYQLAPAFLAEVSFGTALKWVIDDTSRTYDIRIDFLDAGLPKEIDPLVSAVAFRVLRELLINVAKHAGTGAAQVVARRAGNVLHLQVRDQGSGFDHAVAESGLQRGLGLRAARERLALLGGGMEVASKPGTGSCVTLKVPLGALPLV